MMPIFADMTIKKYIADIYGNKEGFKYNQMSGSQIDLKIKYAQEFLNVVGMVDPGTTKVNIITLFRVVFVFLTIVCSAVARHFALRPAHCSYLEG